MSVQEFTAGLLLKDLEDISKKAMNIHSPSLPADALLGEIFAEFQVSSTTLQGLIDSVDRVVAEAEAGGFKVGEESLQHIQVPRLKSSNQMKASSLNADPYIIDMLSKFLSLKHEWIVQKHVRDCLRDLGKLNDIPTREEPIPFSERPPSPNLLQQLEKPNPPAWSKTAQFVRSPKHLTKREKKVKSPLNTSAPVVNHKSVQPSTYENVETDCGIEEARQALKEALADPGPAAKHQLEISRYLGRVQAAVHRIIAAALPSVKSTALSAPLNPSKDSESERVAFSYIMRVVRQLPFQDQQAFIHRVASAVAIPAIRNEIK